MRIQKAHPLAPMATSLTVALLEDVIARNGVSNEAGILADGALWTIRERDAVVALFTDPEDPIPEHWRQKAEDAIRRVRAET